MSTQVVNVLQSSWKLLRLIAVISSSVATILSSMLPLFLYTSLSLGYLTFIFVFLSVAAITFHGALTHLFNDYTDYLSGTDTHSPAILSGGSRIIQQDQIAPNVIYKIGKAISLFLLLIALVMPFLGQGKLTILILIGVWAAASYSLPPLRLSYRPFWGEWISLFPSIFALGIAGPWIIFNMIPAWSVQNALINAFVCMGWVMVHHIPDLEADAKASPKKQTTVLWFASKFGLKYARIPALIYLIMAGFTSIWLWTHRPIATIVVICLTIISIIFILKMDLKNPHQVSMFEKALLIIAMLIAIFLGVF